VIQAATKAGTQRWEDVITKAIDSRGRDAAIKIKNIRKEGRVIVCVCMSCAFDCYDVVVQNHWRAFSSVLIVGTV
jgi:hypothetical protein